MNHETNRHSCPCCGALTIIEPRCFEICAECDWEDDPVQFADPDYEGGANRCSLNQAKSKLGEKLESDHDNGN